MKLRHAAALALVGWYLMAPPLHKGNSLDESTPLKNWTIIGSFDSAKLCNLDQLTLLNETFGAADTNVLKQQARLGVCVATDDPRLAK